MPSHPDFLVNFVIGLLAKTGLKTPLLLKLQVCTTVPGLNMSNLKSLRILSICRGQKKRFICRQEDGLNVVLYEEWG
jgi:hypothetical protein